ncbi:MAG TPA: dipeptide/oligopeptide/nickel ABC transporter permease/ATP-binding protein [Acidimicrobiales bacterium]|nr:dipeptide/oligopeptide/nickel ABC transporter permease/ATP-binding protein [Acidimicrobiales bacterium]
MSVPEHLLEVDAPRPPADTITVSRSERHRSPARVLGAVGAVLLVGLVLVAIFAPLLARHSPTVPSGMPYERPSPSHPLGTNDVGHDLYSQLLHGARISLTIGVLSAVVATVVGLAVALLAGYYRGLPETVLMRFVDLTLSFPFLVLVIVLAAFFGRGLLTTVVVIGAVLWARPARVLRSQVIKVREFQHVTAARAMGASSARVLGQHVLPRVAPLAAAQFVRAANVSVLIEASLAFLGLGDPNRVSWGTMLYFASARNAFLTDAWLWWIVPPGLALTAAVVGFAFLGYAVEEWADPRLARSPVRRPVRRRAPKRTTAPPVIDGETAGPVLEVRHLSVHYRTRSGPARAVDDVDLVVGRGGITGLVGESGSGKSTMAAAILGLARPPAKVTAGQILFEGRDLRGLRRSEMTALRGRRVALIPQSAMNALNPAYPVRRQVAEAAAQTRSPVDAARRASEVLELVGIAPDRHGSFPHELSGGMRQRVIIAMAIVNEPSLLVADEPVTGLDVVTQAKILRLLIDLQSRLGLAMLLISHDLPLVARVAHDLAVMYGGKIVESGPSQAVTANPRHPYTRELLRSFPSLRGPRRRLASIVGEPPDLVTPPPGCRFQPRCPDSVEVCADAHPPFVEVAPGHRVACVHWTRS